MAVNRDKPDRWKGDISRSVDFYNDWFINFAPKAFRETRLETIKQVAQALEWTANLTDIKHKILMEKPDILPMLRMSTCPPIARDRLIGLANASANLVKVMETERKLPARMKPAQIEAEIKKIVGTIERLVDKDIFMWIESKEMPSDREIYRASTIVADRLCGAVANPIIRNAQERRQLASIGKWLENRGYKKVAGGSGITFDQMEPGTFTFRMNVPVELSGGERYVNIPIDSVIMPANYPQNSFPLLVGAKSAGDFTNTNKRRKEEAVKMNQLRGTYGNEIQFILFLCGYFDSGYLGYEAAEGIDWVWEHRIGDFAEFGL